MNIRIFLQLGRISNIPTVWTNCLTGALLSNSFILDYRLFLLLIGTSLLYISGMFMNDAFDFGFDKKYRPSRPAASGKIPVPTVFAWSFLMMLSGLSAILFASTAQPESNGLFAALCLSILIIIYDWKHKNNPLAPGIMGMCRGMLLLTAGLVYSDTINFQLAAGALSLFAWTFGLTLLAKQEHIDNQTPKWPLLFLSAPLFYVAIAVTLKPISWLFLGLLILVIIYTMFLCRSRQSKQKIQMVSLLIASFSLVDGLLLAAGGFESAAMLAGLMTRATLQLQKSIAGT
ncbi:MAG: UbiA family prenyltransferase [Nitrosomonas sp.]